MKSSKVEPVYMFCPNCGKKVASYKDSSDGAKFVCSRCKVNIYSKPRGKREILIRVIENN